MTNKAILAVKTLPDEKVKFYLSTLYKGELSYFCISLQDEENETWEKLLWKINYIDLKYEVSDKDPEQLLVYSKKEQSRKKKDSVYSVVFQKTEKKKLFLKTLIDMPEFV